MFPTLAIVLSLGVALIAVVVLIISRQECRTLRRDRTLWRSRFLHYGRHRRDCASITDARACDCGWQRARAEARGIPSQPATAIDGTRELLNGAQSTLDAALQQTDALRAPAYDPFKGGLIAGEQLSAGDAVVLDAQQRVIRVGGHPIDAIG